MSQLSTTSSLPSHLMRHLELKYECDLLHTHFPIMQEDGTIKIACKGCTEKTNGKRI